jgi:hypothetical protein
MNVYCCVNNRSIMLRDYLGQVPDGGGGGYFYHLVIVKQRYKPANLQKPCACPTLEGRSSTRLGPWVGNELDQVALKAEAESALVKQKDPQGCVPDGGWVTSFVEGFKSDGRGTT